MTPIQMVVMLMCVGWALFIGMWAGYTTGLQEGKRFAYLNEEKD